MMITRLSRSRLLYYQAVQNRAVACSLYPSIQFPVSKQFVSQRSASTTTSPKLPLTAFSPIRSEEEFLQWGQKYILILLATHVSSDRFLASTPGTVKAGKEFDQDSKVLTELCQTQVNYWHRVNPLTNEQIEGVKQIAKLAIVHRNQSSHGFFHILVRGAFQLLRR
jgi:hypothetical protein